MSSNTILIVEDETIVAEDLAIKLRQLGYEVTGIAISGEEALALAERFRPKVVLMDIQLEGLMDGIETAETLRNRHDIPVIYLTAHSDAATLARAKLSGPFGYILKPFEERDLATQIELALYKHQIDRQLREQYEWLRVTLTSIGDGVIATDDAGCIRFINPVAERLTGWKTEAAMGRPVGEVLRIVNEQTGHPPEEPVVRALQAEEAEVMSNQTALVDVDGRHVPIESRTAPIIDSVNRVIGAVLVFHDVSDKRRAAAELQENIDELNEYAYALTHNVKAPFRAIENYVDFLAEDLAAFLESQTKQYLEGIKRALFQANNQFKDLETLYRIRNHSVDLGSFDMRGLLSEIESMLKNESDRKLIVADHWPVFRGEVYLLRQILIELISNGFKYNHRNGKRVEVGWQKGANNGIEIFIRDNGIGIDPQYHGQIFGIFKRLHTDREYEGTGIGLAIVKRAVQKFNGTLRVKSEVGKGSTFYIHIPNSVANIHDLSGKSA